MSSKRLSLAEARDLAALVLRRANTESANAAVVAEALVLAEADLLSSHGLARLPAYADQAAAGKVDGHAVPTLRQTRPAALLVDAGTGFAFPAIDKGLPALQALAGETGIAALAIGNSHHFGVAGHPVEALARAGMLGIAMGNAPAAIAPWGGHKPLFGTNPIAFACPREGHDPIVVDLSLSRVARGKVMLAAQRGQPIPDNWALDADGSPTTDAKAALEGSMLPLGDAKGAALVLMVEILATCLTGSNFGYEASTFFNAKGGPPRVGQFFLAIAPEAMGGDNFATRVETLISAILDQPGTRLPGIRRFEARAQSERDGIVLPEALYADIAARAAG
ncbi:MAG: Ldh family oxidoreductase [Inquilinus sp.]|nr:Ldh family oxidoreductase [Inquilinus sp.]